MTSLPADAWIGIFAHPDDEWLSGWPVFQRMDVRLGVIFFVGDNRLVTSTSNESWEPLLRDVLNRLNIQLFGCIGCAPDFYRLPRSERYIWRDSIQSLLADACTGDFADARLITHNPVGEYGHPDHIEVFRTVLDVCNHLPLLISDLCYEEMLSVRARRLFYQGVSYGPFTLDRRRWAAARSAYQTSLRWTTLEWPSQDTARLYAL